MHLRSLQLVLLLTTSIAACQSKSSTTDQATKQSQASSQVVATSPQSTTTGQSIANDFLIIPGKQVGPIRSTTKRTHPQTVLIRPKFLDDEGLPIPNVAPTRWATADGLRIGTPLKELEERNGKPFKVWGFEWDYGGMVSNWQGGKLTPPNKKSFLSIGLGAPTTKTPAQEKAYNKLMGDSEFLSSSAAMQVLNPVVQRMQVSF